MAPLISPRTPNPQTPALEFASGSPNYFGLVVENGASIANRSGHASQNNWSPPSSRIRSAAADSPQAIPLDANPDFDAFRRQSQRASFHLNHSSISKSNTSSERGISNGTTNSSALCHESCPNSRRQSIPALPHSTLLEPEQQEARSPKRVLSHDPSTTTDRPRRESPAAFHDNFDSNLSRDRLNAVSYGSPPQRDTQEAVLRMPAEISPQPIPSLHSSRAETLPDRLEPQDTPQMVTPQHVVNLIDSVGEELLILDLRVSTQYARCRIVGALNLCVPTTLLKRASHDVQKLAETFKDGAQRTRFEKWRGCHAIVVYDQSSVQLKEATMCQNVLKKFAGEGWIGTSCIIRGGFDEFAKCFTNHLDRSRLAATAPSVTGLSLRPSTPSIAPVIGGCPMPATKNAANPFFGNIRQNMDLIGGVGQFMIRHPQELSHSWASVPSWLACAADEKDEGKAVAEKFLQIEKREQQRMQEALSAHVSFGTPEPERSANGTRVQVAGIEKGAKNRYTNIWPFEHSRVKLEDAPQDGCDYVNASYVHTSLSNKRFVATQGPLPSTFTDFWRMMWQTKARVIVMLTGEREGGQVKAHNYWSEHQYGPMRLKFLAERKVSLEPERLNRKRDVNRPARASPPEDLEASKAQRSNLKVKAAPASEQAYVVVRKFTLSHNDRPFDRMREITQLQYSSWPDFGVPTHPAHLLGLVEQCAAVVRSSSAADDAVDGTARPIIVHCSAGCGRTGTFCTVDTVIDILKRRKHMDVRLPDSPRTFLKSINYPTLKTVTGAAKNSDDVDLIEKVVEEFRLQRLSMVQSLRQFVLCYEAVLEWTTQKSNSHDAA